MEHRKSQVKSSKPWRWTCPHCLGGTMKLPSAARHLRRLHNTCWSCRIEAIMVDSMILGRGWLADETQIDVFGVRYPWREWTPVHLR